MGPKVRAFRGPGQCSDCPGPIYSFSLWEQQCLHRDLCYGTGRLSVCPDTNFFQSPRGPLLVSDTDLLRSVCPCGGHAVPAPPGNTLHCSCLSRRQKLEGQHLHLRQPASVLWATMAVLLKERLCCPGACSVPGKQKSSREALFPGWKGRSPDSRGDVPPPRYCAHCQSSSWDTETEADGRCFTPRATVSSQS